MNDETRSIRPGEELNDANLREFLRANGFSAIDKIEISQFPAGSSNLTYSVKIGADEFVLRRPPFGSTVKSAHDMAREYRVLSALSAVYSPAPKPILFCADDSVIGAEFYLMERKKGVILRGENVTKNLIRSPQLQKDVCESFVNNLADLHRLDYQTAGLDRLGKPEGYVERQTIGWIERYQKAKTDEWPELEAAIVWLSANVPVALNSPTLVHNDYKFDNVMLDSDDLTRVVGVLDWEMATIGEPLMDLGTTLGYWMDAAEAPEFLLKMPFNPRVLITNFTRQELAERYAAQTGADLSDLLFYYVFGTFKIAVIAQQIYFRYQTGKTSDRRFASFNQFVRALGRIAAKALETGKV